MAVTLTPNWLSAVAETTKTLTYNPWDWSRAWRVSRSAPDDARMVATTTPINESTTVKVTREWIEDVYKTLANDIVPVSEQVANRKGITTRVEVRTSFTETIVDEAGNVIGEYQLPVEADIRFRNGLVPVITDEQIDQVLGLAVAALKDDQGNTRVASEMMRGVLTPAGTR